MGRLFGTDGVRGVANELLTPELALKIGQAAAMVLTKTGEDKPKILIGMDTRISGDMLQSALIAGICSVGADVITVGVLPTPAVAYLIKALDCSAGVMISASHNPHRYNGIKIFDKMGYKLPDSLEDEIESIVSGEKGEVPTAKGGKIGVVKSKNDAADLYADYIKSTVDVDFKGLKIALDCANGAASATAKKVFAPLGAECFFLNDKPDGVNINEGCGSTHLDGLKTFVLENKCDIGVAFDGDADRCLCVDSEGNEVDGDQLIAIAALDMKNRGKLKNNTAVMTVMSNVGFFKFAEENDIKVAVTKVGDRYVLEEMREKGYIIGGEQSGHVIYLDYVSTGDGQISALQALAVMKRTGKPLKELASVMEKYPQVLVNVKTTPQIKEAYAEDAEFKSAVKQVEDTLGNNGRVLVRASGTEPLIRVMIEGKNTEEIQQQAEYIAEKIRNL